MLLSKCHVWTEVRRTFRTMNWVSSVQEICWQHHLMANSSRKLISLQCTKNMISARHISISTNHLKNLCKILFFLEFPKLCWSECTHTSEIHVYFLTKLDKGNQKNLEYSRWFAYSGLTNPTVNTPNRKWSWLCAVTKWEESSGLWPEAVQHFLFLVSYTDWTKWQYHEQKCFHLTAGFDTL